MSSFNYSTNFHLDNGTFFSGDGTPVIGPNGRLIYESFTGASNFVISGGTFIAASRERLKSNERTQEDESGDGAHRFPGEGISSDDNNLSSTRVGSYSMKSGPNTNAGYHRETLRLKHCSTAKTSLSSFFTDAEGGHIRGGIFTIAEQPPMEPSFVPFSGIGCPIGGNNIPRRRSSNIVEASWHALYHQNNLINLHPDASECRISSSAASSQNPNIHSNIPPYLHHVLEPSYRLAQYFYWPTFSSCLEKTHPEQPIEINMGGVCHEIAYSIASSNQKRQTRVKKLKHKKKLLSLKLI